MLNLPCKNAETLGTIGDGDGDGDGDMEEDGEGDGGGDRDGDGDGVLAYFDTRGF